MPISHQPWLYNSALAFSAFPTLVGLQLLWHPNSGLDMLGFTKPTGSEAQKLTESLFMFFGARDLALGLCTLAAWRGGKRQTLGWMLVVGSGLTVIDGFINKRQVGKGQWKHWIFTPFGIGIGGGLLGWLD